MWSLDAELMRLARTDSVRDALRTLAMLPNADARFDLHEVQDWDAVGSETHLYVFELVSEGVSRRYALKALTSFSGVPLAELTEEWLRRRRICSEAGVGVPPLYATGSSTILEEYVPYGIAEALGMPPSNRRDRLITAIAATCVRLEVAGFDPVSLHDWRSHGYDVVLVDFGEDLGASLPDRHPPAARGRLLDLALRMKWLTEPADVTRLRSAYDSLFAPPGIPAPREGRRSTAGRDPAGTPRTD